MSLPETFRLGRIEACTPQQVEAVRRLRNLPAIRDAMYGDQVIPEAEHAAWVNSLRGDARRLVLAALNDGDEPVGVASLTAIDRVHGRADWGFYMGPGAPQGLGGVVLATLLDHAFGELGLEKVNGEVIEGNAASLALHHKLGFRDEGCRRSHVRRAGGRRDVHLLGLTAAEWREARESVRAVLPLYAVRLEPEA